MTMIGKKHTEEWKENHSRILTGRKRPDQSRFMLNNNPFRGKHHTEKSKEKIRLRKLGRKQSIEEKIKQISKQTGKPIHTEKHKEELRLKFIGEKNPMWEGGISFEPYPPEFNTILKKKILDKFNKKCVLCTLEKRETVGKLAVHHIDYDKRNNNEENLMVLCNSHHSKTNGNRYYHKQYLPKLINLEMENKNG